MVTFLTIILGLVVGPRHFELAVAETTARVEISLDGRVETELFAPPWEFEIDLGESLLPRELSATAYDANDTILGQASQRLNVPHPPVEVAIAIESEGGQARAARLAWAAAADEAMTGFRVRLDGRRLPADDPNYIPLPHLDPGQPHHLSAEITFKRRLRTQTAVVFGGTFIDQVNSELTAIVVERLPSHAGSLPTAAQLAGWFHRQGAPLSVFAVEQPPIEIMLVRDQISSRKLSKLVGTLGVNRPGQNSLSTTRARLLERRVEDLGVGLTEDDWLRVMATQPEQRIEAGKAIFRASGDVLEIARGLGMGIAGLNIPADDRPERLADAVASSGLEVAGGGRRRAVVLVADPKTKDESLLTPTHAETYLAAMRVPLVVWTAGDVDAMRKTWGAATNVAKIKRMSAAVSALERRLDRQLVVWLKGRLLPSDIELTTRGEEFLSLPSPPLAR